MSQMTREFVAPAQCERIMTEYRTVTGVEYALSTPVTPTERTVVFHPGMACNKFGHPVSKVPKNAVGDLVELASDSYNLLFPEINIPEKIGDMEPIRGLTIECQNQKMVDVLSDAARRIELGDVTYVGQSLGSLAVARFAAQGGFAENERAVFWGPPTLEGPEHRDVLVSKFAHKPETKVNAAGEGQLQLGNGRLMFLDFAYWDSIDRNSLRSHHEAMASHFHSVIAICAIRDTFYPGSASYLEEHVPTAVRYDIEGSSHTFKHDSMRSQLQRIMHDVLFGRVT